MKHLSNILVASLEDAGVISVTVDERTDAQIDIEAERDAIEHLDAIEEEIQMVQSMESLLVNVRNLVNNGTASVESAALIQSSLESLFMNREFVIDRQLGFEAGADVVVYHNHVIASLEGFIRKIGQNIKQSFSQAMSGYSNVLQSQSARARKMSKAIADMENWIKKHDLEEVGDGKDFRSAALAAVYHVGGKRPDDLVKAIRTDRDTIVGAMSDYRASTEKAISALLSALNGSNSDEKLTEAVSKVKHPTADIKASYLAKDVLLSSLFIKLTDGKPIVNDEGYGSVNSSVRVKFDMSIAKNVVKALPAILFSNLAFVVGGKGHSSVSPLELLKETRSYVDYMKTAIERDGKISGLLDNAQMAANKAVENGVSKSAVNAVTSIINDLAVALASAEKAAWSHGLNVCVTSINATGSLARKLNKGEMPKEFVGYIDQE